jgi:hypothetical protein
MDKTTPTTYNPKQPSRTNSHTGSKCRVRSGNYIDTNGVTHGFLYDGTDYKTVDAPDAKGYTSITGFDGVSYAGSYIDANGSTHGFLYDGTNYTVIDDPLAAQIPRWVAWNCYGSVFKSGGLGSSGRGGRSVSPKPQKINVHVYKPSTKSGGNPSVVRLVATSPAGEVSFLTSSNSVVTSTSSYRSPKFRVYVTTAIVNVNDSKRVTVTAYQLGNSEFAPAKKSVNPRVIRNKSVNPRVIRKK